MSNSTDRTKNKLIELYFLPGFLRSIIKKLYWYVIRRYNRIAYIKKGKFVEFGYRFRFSRKIPFCCYMGDKTIVEEFNTWNAKQGDIVVGKNCWFGIRNIVMGPIEIGDKVSTGPNVSLLGPRHAIYGYDLKDRKKTEIGTNVWISTGSIIHFGVTIGDNAVIGPGSVITKDVPEDSYFAGNPARNLSQMMANTWNNKKNEE